MISLVCIKTTFPHVSTHVSTQSMRSCECATILVILAQMTQIKGWVKDGCYVLNQLKFRTYTFDRIRTKPCQIKLVGYILAIVYSPKYLTEKMKYLNISFRVLLILVVRNQKYLKHRVNIFPCKLSVFFLTFI